MTDGRSVPGRSSETSSSSRDLGTRSSSLIPDPSAPSQPQVDNVSDPRRAWRAPARVALGGATHPGLSFPPSIQTPPHQAFAVAAGRGTRNEAMDVAAPAPPPLGAPGPRGAFQC